MKRKILGIPVVVIICILAMVLASGIAYAAMDLFTGGQVTVQVQEAIAIDASAGPSAVYGGTAVWTSADSSGTPYTNTLEVAVFPNNIVTMPITITNNGDMPVTVSIALVPKLFPGSSLQDDGVIMSIDDTGMILQSMTFFPDPAGDLTVSSAGLALFGPTTSAAITLGSGDADTINVTLIAGNSAVDGYYAWDLVISR